MSDDHQPGSAVAPALPATAAAGGLSGLQARIQALTTENAKLQDLIVKSALKYQTLSTSKESLKSSIENERKEWDAIRAQHRIEVEAAKKAPQQQQLTAIQTERDTLAARVHTLTEQLRIALQQLGINSIALPPALTGLTAGTLSATDGKSPHVNAQRRKQSSAEPTAAPSETAADSAETVSATTAPTAVAVGEPDTATSPAPAPAPAPVPAPSASPPPAATAANSITSLLAERGRADAAWRNERATLVSTHERAIAQLSSSHAEALSALRTTHEAEADKWARERDRHSRELDAIRAMSEEHKTKLTAQLYKVGTDRLALAQKEQQLTSSIQNLMSEQTARDSLLQSQAKQLRELNQEKSDLIAALSTLQTTYRREQTERDALRSQLEAAQRAANAAAEQYAADATEASTQYETLQRAYDEQAAELASAHRTLAATATATSTAAGGASSGGDAAFASPAPKVAYASSLLPPPAAQALRTSHSALDIKFDVSKLDGTKSPAGGGSGTASPALPSKLSPRPHPQPAAAAAAAVVRTDISSPAPAGSGSGAADSKRNSLTLSPALGVGSSPTAAGGDVSGGVGGIRVATIVSTRLEYPNDVAVLPPPSASRGWAAAASGDDSDSDAGDSESDTAVGAGADHKASDSGSKRNAASPLPPYLSTSVILLCVDQFNHRIVAVRADDGGGWMVVAGSGTRGSADHGSNPLLATFDHPRCIAVYHHRPSHKSSGRSGKSPASAVSSSVAGVTGSTVVATAATAAVSPSPPVVAALSLLGGSSRRRLTIYVTHSHCIRRIAPDGSVTTFAGKERGYADGIGTGAAFSEPKGITVCPATGTVYVCDSANHRIRRITVNGEVSTLAGTGVRGYADCKPGQSPVKYAQFDSPHHIVIDSMANPYHHHFRGGEQIEGGASGAAAAAGDEKHTPSAGTGAGAAAGSGPFLYVSDKNNHCIRRIDLASGEVSTFSGLPTHAGSADGYADTARFDKPTGLAIDAEHNLYVTDASQGVRMISSADGAVWSIAGGGAARAHASVAAAQAASAAASSAVAATAGGGASADSKSPAPAAVAAVPVVDPAMTAALTRIGKKGFADGEAGAAEFAEPSGLAVYCTPLTGHTVGTGGGGGGGSVFVWVADAYNHSIRKIFDPSRKRTDRADSRLRWLKSRALTPSAVPAPASHDVCAACDVRFGYIMSRRHHCMSCGDSLCYDCCHDWITFPPLFGDKSGAVRVCEVCSTFLSACLATSVGAENDFIAESNKIVAPPLASASASHLSSYSQWSVDKKETPEQVKRRERILRATEKRVAAANAAAAAAAAARAANSPAALVSPPAADHTQPKTPKLIPPHGGEAIQNDMRLAL